jgi:hypothetical protein
LSCVISCSSFKCAIISFSSLTGKNSYWHVNCVFGHQKSWWSWSNVIWKWWSTLPTNLNFVVFLSSGRLVTVDTPIVTHSQVPKWTHLRVHQSVVAESWDSEGAPGFQL